MKKHYIRFLEFDYILGRVQERLSSILLQFSCTELQYHIGVISWWQNCFVCSLFRFRPGVEPSPVPTWNIQSRPVFTANSAAAQTLSRELCIPGLSLVSSHHVTWTLGSDWSLRSRAFCIPGRWEIHQKPNFPCCRSSHNKWSIHRIVAQCTGNCFQPEYSKWLVLIWGNIDLTRSKVHDLRPFTYTGWLVDDFYVFCLSSLRLMIQKKN